MTPSIPDLRQYLTAAYSDADLGILCADYFRDVYENFADGMTKAQKIQLLLDHCQRRELLPNLVGALERDRPEQYRRRFTPPVVAPRVVAPPPGRDPHPVAPPSPEPGRGDQTPTPAATPSDPVGAGSPRPVAPPSSEPGRGDHAPTPAVVRAPDPAPPAVLILTSPIRLELVRIPAGEFLMGSDPAVDKHAQADEQPQHRVGLPDFYIGKGPVTNVQFEAFVRAKGYKTTAEKWSFGANWRHPRGPKAGIAQEADHPVVQVSWDDAVAFCQWLCETTGQEFRLPTEAEWEKTARGPQARIYPWGDEPPDANRCNFNRNVGDTTPVGQYTRGATPDYGVLDMAGNVWEWCSDWYDEKAYQGRPDRDTRNPTGPAFGIFRVFRGGTWSSSQKGVRCASRIRTYPGRRLVDFGFRVARGSLT